MSGQLSTLRAVDGAAASLRAEIRSLSNGDGIVLLKDVPARFRAVLMRQGAEHLTQVNGEPALRVADVEKWIDDVRHSFHLADSCESIPGISFWRRWSFAGLSDGKLGKREVKFAQGEAAKAGLTPMMALISERLALPAPADAEQKLLPAPTGARLPSALVDKIAADGKVESHEVWQAVEAMRNEDGAHEALQAFRNEHGKQLTSTAAQALDAYLQLGEINATLPVPHPSLEKLWKETRRDWDLSAIEDPGTNYTAEESTKLSRPIFQTTNAEGYRLANEVKAFFERYPSTGGRVLSSFFAGWAINETFGDMPLQAWNYTHAHPVDKKGRPRTPLWQAYATAVDTGAPRDVIEEAFFRATIADYKESTSAPEFKALYKVAPKSYRKVVDAYVHTLRAVEAELDLGTKPMDVAKRYPLAVTRELVRRGTIGMVWKPVSFVNGLNPTNALTREWWFGFWGMLGTFVSNRHPKTAPQTAIAIDLDPTQRAQIAQELQLQLPASVKTLDAKSIAKATFTEPPRGFPTDEPLPRYPLALSDFARIDPIHAPMKVSGVDGVFDADELHGVIRQAQSRVRSNLIEEFHAKYPTPMNGLLVYSANMLALTGSYHQHTAYGMVPNFIMPVDPFGRPKTAKWQAYVDAHESAKATGAPSKETIERLWFEAHMEDFEQVDSEEFREQAELFWRDAIRDPALAPLATYFIAMVHGRRIFDAARAERLPYEAALVRSFDHFRHTLMGAGTIPFLGDEIANVGKLFTDYRNEPDFDKRGLPTDKLLTKRMLEGLVAASGIAGTLIRGGLFGERDNDGVLIAKYTVGDGMVDLKAALPAAKFNKLDRSVVRFYKNPTMYDVDAHVTALEEHMDDDESLIFDTFKRMAVHVVTQIGAGVIGTQATSTGDYAVEDDLLRDRDGNTHWNRYVVGKDGHRKALFLASFEASEGMIKETFKTRLGVPVPLYFDVDVRDGGLLLTMNREKSSPIVSTFADITFFTKPGANGGLTVRGELKHRVIPNARSVYTATMTPKADPTAAVQAQLKMHIPKVLPSAAKIVAHTPSSLQQLFKKRPEITPRA